MTQDYGARTMLLEWPWRTLDFAFLYNDFLVSSSHPFLRFVPAFGGSEYRYTKHSLTHTKQLAPFLSYFATAKGRVFVTKPVLPGRAHTIATHLVIKVAASLSSRSPRTELSRALRACLKGQSLVLGFALLPVLGCVDPLLTRRTESRSVTMAT